MKNGPLSRSDSFRIYPFLLLMFHDQLILFMSMHPFDELPLISVSSRSTLQYRENTPYPHMLFTRAEINL